MSRIVDFVSGMLCEEVNEDRVMGFAQEFGRRVGKGKELGSSDGLEGVGTTWRRVG